MFLDLQGKRAAVAAASTGLGFASAAALAAEGAQVAICSRSRERIQPAAERIGAIGLVHDVGTPEGAQRFIAEAREALGGLDILIVNAGGPPVGNFMAFDMAGYRDALDLNLLSTVAMCQEALPGMRAQKWGRVVAITSMSARRPKAQAVLTATARAGASAFLKSISMEVAADGVTVNSVQTGYHDTQRIQDLYGDKAGALTAGIPTGTIGRPEDFGAVVAFLCSGHARFINGVALPVDGGAYPALF